MNDEKTQSFVNIFTISLHVSFYPGSWAASGYL